jgi:hypothetical protein
MVSGLELNLGEVSAKHAKDCCSIGEKGKFAYAYHRRDGVRVYLRSHESDGIQMSALLGTEGLLSLKKRTSMASAWAKLSPYYLELDSAANVARALPLLVYTARYTTSTNAILYHPPSEEAAEEQVEGGRVTVQVNRFERDSGARKRCIKLFGTACSVCGFDFERAYGDIGIGFIHVHHLIPLAIIRQRYKINARTDLRPVCPNCHEMLHKKKPPFSVEELKAKISM